MTKTPIMLAGHVCIDHNTVHGKTIHRWGSPLMYIAAYFGRAHPDAPISALAPHGKDFSQYRGNLDLLPRHPLPTPTLVYNNVVADNGHRTQYCLHSQYATPPALGKEEITALNAASIVFVAPLTPQYGSHYIRTLLSHTKNQALKVLLPQGYLRQIGKDGLVSVRPFYEASELMPLFDLVVLSDEDTPGAVHLAGQWRKYSRHTAIVVTENKEGATLFSHSDNTHIPTDTVPQSDIINPIGCGDVFSAATAYAYFHTRDWTKAVKAGHQAARQSLLGASL